jgi:hypothetical protein
VTYTTTADSNGDWSVDLENDTPSSGMLPSGGLPEGEYDTTVTSTDAAGNSSSDTFTLTVEADPQQGRQLFLPFMGNQ